jgi:hypothetical protein
MNIIAKLLFTVLLIILTVFLFGALNSAGQDGSSSIFKIALLIGVGYGLKEIWRIEKYIDGQLDKVANMDAQVAGEPSTKHLKDSDSRIKANQLNAHQNLAKIRHGIDANMTNAQFVEYATLSVNKQMAIKLNDLGETYNGDNSLDLKAQIKRIIDLTCDDGLEKYAAIASDCGFSRGELKDSINLLHEKTMNKFMEPFEENKVRIQDHPLYSQVYGAIRRAAIEADQRKLFQEGPL